MIVFYYQEIIIDNNYSPLHPYILYSIYLFYFTFKCLLRKRKKIDILMLLASAHVTTVHCTGC